MEQSTSNTVTLLPRAWDRIDAPTNGFHVLKASLMIAADQGGSTVVADITTIFGGNIAEEPKPLELADRVVDRIRTDLVEALTAIWQPGSDP